MVAVLPTADQAFLDEGIPYHVDEEGGMVCVVFEQFPLAAGLTPATTDLLVRLPPGFPDAGPDMFWCAQAVTRVDGAQIPATEVVESYLGQPWHRWSRHIGGQWRPGIDGLRSYVAYIRKCLVDAAA
jgi:Prokaryotic E2 family E